MKRPVTPELRKYLLDLVREERSLETLYRASHDGDELRAIRAEWKAAYRQIRESMVAEDLRLRAECRCHQAGGCLRILPATL